MSALLQWRSLAALSASVVVGAHGQTAPPASPAPLPAAPADAAPSSRPNVTPYRSAFENYRPFADEKLVPWKEANETVRAIGGWRAYAKEANEDKGKPASASGEPADPHAGHHKP